MAFRKILFGINLFRVIPVYVITKNDRIWSTVSEDMEKNLYYRKPVGIGERLKNKSAFIQFGNLVLFDDTFRNVLFYRLKSVSKGKAAVLKLLFPLKKDCEIQCPGKIGPGFVVCHGHGTVILAESIGRNFTVFQGVTVGKNPRPYTDRTMPVIGDNVSIYTNAVVAGPIQIGDNVNIGAGAVCMQDVESDSVVYGNPCFIKKKEKHKEVQESETIPM